MLRLGLIINPFAGIGGSVGLKGSDGDAIRAEALARGADQRALQRTQRCLEKLIAFRDSIQLFCFSGDMGENAVAPLQFNYTLVGHAQADVSSAHDTHNAVGALIQSSVDIIIFAGGDGTARNIADALIHHQAEHQIVLGIPSGVKMHSGVYAITPEAAGDLLVALLNQSPLHVQACDVKDIDEAAFRDGKVKARLYGSMRVPVIAQFLQQVKNSGAEQDELVKLDIAHYLIDNMEDNHLYVVGPGSTTFTLLTELGVEGTLLGVDVIVNRELIAADVTAQQLRELLLQHTGPSSLIITAIGGQGHIIGRGNQQLAPDILKTIGRAHIQIIATHEKIRSLQKRPLLVDSNDPQLDAEFSGYQSVLVGYNEFLLYPVGNASPAVG